MAVLKRGDKPETPSLDSPRRFARSFILAWELLCGNSGRFLKIQLCPAIVAGIVGCIWLSLYSNDVFWNDGWYGILTDTLVGVVFLFVFSVMRLVQKQMILDASETGTVLFRVYTSSIRKAVSTWIPLLCAAVVVCAARCLLKSFGADNCLSMICTGVAAVVFFAGFGMVQSYMELCANPFRKSFVKGLSLNCHYFGSFCILFLLSAVMLSVSAVVLFYGSFVLQISDDNYSSALIMGEELEKSLWVSILKYPLFFLATAFVTMLQPVWSLPQQIHIRSVVFKDNNRSKSAKRKKRGGLSEETENSTVS
jgi:hypothetical protein